MTRLGDPAAPIPRRVLAGLGALSVAIALVAGCDQPPPKAPITPRGKTDRVQIPAGGAFFPASGNWGEYHREVATFAIDRHEVTTDQYARCVAAQACTPAKRGDHCNARRVDRADHPINCVDRAQAEAYCGWAGGRLPTEAEWQRAAFGDGPERFFAWGKAKPDPSRANLCGSECTDQSPIMRLRVWGPYEGTDPWPTTAPVGAVKAGASAFGIEELGGNVREWTGSTMLQQMFPEVCVRAPDWHGVAPRKARSGAPDDKGNDTDDDDDDDFEDDGDDDDAEGSLDDSPCEPVERAIVRGGSFAARDLHAASHAYFWHPHSSSQEPDLGFRCAESAPGTECFAECSQTGRCSWDGNQCLADSDESCRRSDECEQLGHCTAVDGACKLTDSDDCRATFGCQTIGHCSYRDGDCVVGSSVDCRRSHACTAHARCLLQGEDCVISSADDCRQSAHLCKELGACGFDRGDCIVVSDEDCSASKRCQEDGSCTMLNEQNCRPKTDAHCRGSAACRKLGRCFARKDVCTELEDEDCAKSENCRTYGACHLQDDRCTATSQADCQKAAICAGKRCRLSDGECEVTAPFP